MIYELLSAGANRDGRSFDVWSRNGAYAGIIAEHYGKGCKVYFNSNATRGSKRVFASVTDALEFMHARRVKRGMTAA